MSPNLFRCFQLETALEKDIDLSQISEQTIPLKSGSRKLRRIKTAPGTV